MSKQRNKNCLEEIPKGLFNYASNEEDLYNKLYKDVYEKKKPNKKLIKEIKKFFKGIEKVDIKIEEIGGKNVQQ